MKCTWCKRTHSQLSLLGFRLMTMYGSTKSYIACDECVLKRVNSLVKEGVFRPHFIDMVKLSSY